MSSLKPPEGKNLHWNNAFKLMMSKNVRKGDLLQQQQESNNKGSDQMNCRKDDGSQDRH